MSQTNTQSVPAKEDGQADVLTKVAIVDDHVMVAEGVALLLNNEPDLEVVGITSTAADAIRLVAEHEPDVVVMDFNLPDQDGTFATAEIMRHRPDTIVVMFSAQASEVLLARAVEAGCAGFISKSQTSAEIVAAVRAASRGESIVPTAMLTSLLAHLANPPKPTSYGLTARELEVLQHLAQGDTTDKMSTELFLSIHTVRNHVRNILTKLGAHSKLGAVAIAAREGIITLADDVSN